MTVHLVCNAHLDPAWLWELDEGAAEVLSTFRVAADFCEDTEGLIFNHNEALLYEWIREYDPVLFDRIRNLVAQRKWHIMGGWYLQPDCNMPSGESFVRQILVGRRFFREAFGAEPQTAINFDPFGHSRGLVQILARSGYSSYIHCRPDSGFLELPSDYYKWVGFDGSSVIAVRRSDGYNTQPGKAADKILWTMDAEADREHVLVLWGIGDHGGGPSREDLARISRLRAELLARGADEGSRPTAASPGVAGGDTTAAQTEGGSATPGPTTLRHATPESFFAALQKEADALPEWRKSLNPWAPGCYTSQVRIKQRHRALENLLFFCERMAVHAAVNGLATYPRDELADAQRDLLISQFHDILPGTSIKPVEQWALQLMGHGMEILSRVRRRLFFALANPVPAPPEGAIPIFAYNPSPQTSDGIWECEFQPVEQNWEASFTDYEIIEDGQVIPSQIEHEESSLTLDWRKKIVFRSTLPAASLSRFLCRPVVREQKPAPRLVAAGGLITVTGDELTVSISTKTGLVEHVRYAGEEVLSAGACSPLVISDYEDSWGSTVRSFREVVGRFELMSDARAAEWRGFPDSDLKAVHVVEDGPVRAVIEAVLAYHDSVCLLTYKLPYSGCSVDLDVTMFWNEKSRMAKLSLPVAIADGRFLGQVPYGVEELATNGDEVVSQQWQAVADPNRDLAFGVVDNGIYGSDFSDGELRISLLRGAVYSALSIGERPLVSADRYHPRIDQGERTFSLRFLFGKKSALIPRMGAIAAQFNEPPYLLSMFTDGRGELPPRGVSLSDPEVICGACKAADAGDGVIVRLFNPTTERKEGRAVLGEHSRGQRRVDPAEPGSNEAGGNGPRPALTGRAELPRDFDFSYSIGPAQVRTYHVRPTGEVSECDLIEEPLPPAR